MLPRALLVRTSLRGLLRPPVAARARVQAASVKLLASQVPRAYSGAAAARRVDDEEDFFGPSSSAPPIRASGRSTARYSEPTQAGSHSPAEDDFFGDVPSSSRLSSPSTSAAGPTIDGETPTLPQLTPFTSLKGRISHDTLKALTFKPFQLVAMSEVQKRVLGLMPHLAGGKLRGEAAEEARRTGDEAALAEGEREDLLVKAKTGTGKTIAFLVPAIDARLNKLDELNRIDENGQAIPTRALRGLNDRSISRSHVGTVIISPTRELATQIANEALKLCTWHKEMQVRLFVGGESRHQQLRDWKRGRKDILVATPGRLRDLLSEPVVADAIKHADLLVLDEADTLLEMGFSNDLNFIIDHLPKSRQTFLFSATVSPEIAKIARASLKPHHIMIDCVPKNESNTHQHIPQTFTALESADQQVPTVLRMIAQEMLARRDAKLIVFLPTTKLTMLFATILRELSDQLPNRLAVHEIHSKLDQRQRSRASERFRRDRMQSVLVTSDVSARGVDYPGVTRVIQVGVPTSAEQYIHRVGRTGRAGKEGKGDLVLLPWEQGFVRELKNVPITPYTTSQIESDLADLASPNYASTLETLDESVAKWLPTLDPAAIEEVVVSLLGYYVGRMQDIGIAGNQLVSGIKDYATAGIGMEEAPYFSATLLAKMGLNQKRAAPRQSNGGFGRSGSRPGFGMRGRTSGGGGGRDGAFRKSSDRPPRKEWSSWN